MVNGCIKLMEFITNGESNGILPTDGLLTTIVPYDGRGRYLRFLIRLMEYHVNYLAIIANIILTVI